MRLSALGIDGNKQWVIKVAEFEGDRIAAELFLSSIQGRFYVYELIRPDGHTFYVGKGMKRRVFEHEAEARRNHPIGEANPFKCNVIRKIVREGGRITYRIDAVFDQENEIHCLEREAALIEKYKRLHEGGILTNLAGGLGNMSGSAPFSLNRHTATLSGEPDENPERAILNKFLQGIGGVRSVPIKPVSQISRILPTKPHPNPRSPSLRCAYALIASACATGIQLKPGALVPRAFSYQGVDAIIENGVSRDLVKAEMATVIAGVEPRDERFQLSASQINLLVGLYGEDALIERGLL